MKLEITTKIGCINRCSYCPQDKLLKSYFKTGNEKSELTVDDFKTILSNIPEGIKLHFSGMCEPFLNKNCSTFIKMAETNKNPLAAYSTLVGATMDDIKIIKNIEINPFGISILEEEHSKWIIDNFELWTSMVDELLQVKRLKFNFVGDKLINPQIFKYLKDNHISFPRNPILSRAGNVIPTKTNLRPWKCKQDREYQNIILPNGDIVLCCMDYSLQHIIGNIFNKKLLDIYQDEPFQNILKSKKDINIPVLCRNCDFAIFF